MQAINEEETIQQETTPPYSPNKNASERFWRTLIEGIPAMLLMIMAGMNKSWWVDATKYFIYVYNRTPKKQLRNKTPLIRTIFQTTTL